INCRFSFIHRYCELSVAGNTFFITNSLFKSLAKCNTNIFSRVMIINFYITVAINCKSNKPWLVNKVSIWSKKPIFVLMLPFPVPSIKKSKLIFVSAVSLLILCCLIMNHLSVGLFLSIQHGQLTLLLKLFQ